LTKAQEDLEIRNMDDGPRQGSEGLLIADGGVVVLKKRHNSS
jgi:hypothetical protein